MSRYRGCLARLRVSRVRPQSTPNSPVERVRRLFVNCLSRCVGRVSLCPRLLQRMVSPGQVRSGCSLKILSPSPW